MTSRDRHPDPDYLARPASGPRGSADLGENQRPTHARTDARIPWEAASLSRAYANAMADSCFTTLEAGLFRLLPVFATRQESPLTGYFVFGLFRGVFSAFFTRLNTGDPVDEGLDLRGRDGNGRCRRPRAIPGAVDREWMIGPSTGYDRGMDLHRQIIDDVGIRPLDRAIYDQMVALGAFDRIKVELIEGVLVPTSPQGAPHSHVIKVLTKLLVQALDGRADVLIQSPFAASDVAEPEPDVAVVPMGDWIADHPDHAHLIIEVAVSSQRFDRGSKARLYAASRVEEYWIVDVPAGTVTVYRDSSGGAWHTMTTHARGSVMSIRAFPDVQVAVAAILPPVS